MPNALCQTTTTQYRSLFPDWSGPRPLSFFLLEHLLEARRQSTFPTNLAGPDEDVNVYLAHLLTQFLAGHHSAQIQFGAQPLLTPPDNKLGRRHQAEFYRTNADHRLIMLGLFNRGENQRNRPILFGMNRQETQMRDIGVGQNCYQMAVNLLENRNVVPSAILDVWQKLADNFDLYVQVLSTMAVSRLGLGAQLSQTDMSLLLTGPAPSEALDPAQNDQQMDRLLDLLLELRQSTDMDEPMQQKRAEIIDLALHLNLDPQKLLQQTG